MSTWVQAKQIAKNVAPGGEWWRESSGQTIAVAAYKMLVAGMTFTVQLLLEDVIAAMREEYGE